MPRNSSRSRKRERRVLVTGGSGFVGRFLVRELMEQDRFGSIAAPSSRALNLLSPQKIRRYLQKHRPGVVFHVAGLSDPASSWSELWDANVMATIHLMEAVRALPPSRRPTVVVAGSAAEYGVPPRLPVTEADRLRPVTTYGMSKMCQGVAALAYARFGVRVILARIFNVLGPGLPGSLAAGSFCQQVAALERRRGKGRLMVGDLQAARDYVDVRDVARALALLGRKGVPGSTYNVCSGQAVSVREMVAELKRLAMVPIEVRLDRSRRRAAGPRRFLGNPRKISKATGWKPVIRWKTSLSDTLDFYRGEKR